MMRRATRAAALASVGLVALLAAAAIAGETAARGAHANHGVSANAGVPLAFVENRGQADARVRYYAQGNRYAFFATRDEVMLSLGKQKGASQLALALRFVSRNPRSAPEG